MRLLQPFADGIKLFLKEMVIPHQASAFVYFFASVASFILAFIIWGFFLFLKKILIVLFSVGLSHFFYKCLYCFNGWGIRAAA